MSDNRSPPDRSPAGKSLLLAPLVWSRGGETWEHASFGGLVWLEVHQLPGGQFQACACPADDEAAVRNLLTLGDIPTTEDAKHLAVLLALRCLAQALLSVLTLDGLLQAQLQVSDACLQSSVKAAADAATSAPR